MICPHPGLGQPLPHGTPGRLHVGIADHCWILGALAHLNQFLYRALTYRIPGILQINRSVLLQHQTYVRQEAFHDRQR